MVTPRRSAAVLLALLLFGVWFTLLRPAALGGPATFIMVSGVSMEPTYHNGDLVVLRRSSSYQAGDIVAYPMELSRRLVIHRIVGQDSDGFITQGDNRESEDPWRPTAETITGEAWLHIPEVGTYLAWMQHPWRLAALAAGIVLMSGLRTAQAERKRRRSMNRIWQRTPGAPPPAPGSGALWALITGLGIAALAGLAFLTMAVVSFRASADAPVDIEEPAFEQTGSFAYAITMDPSTLYPDGVLRSPPRVSVAGEAVGATDEASAPAEDGEASAPTAFTSLAREAEIGFEYALTSETEVEASGTFAVDLVLRAADGSWEHHLEQAVPEAFDGTSLSRTITVDLAGVRETVRRILEETGFSTGAYEVVAAPRVAIEGTRDGEPFESVFEAPFVLGYTNTLITPPATLEMADTTTVTRTVVRPQNLSLLGSSLRVDTARVLAATGFLVSLVAGVGFGGLLVWSLASDENVRIRARYGARIMDVHTPRGQRSKAPIRVASIRDLDRLAERMGGLILHETTGNGHRYFVRDGTDTYEYSTPEDASRSHGAAEVNPS